MAFGGHFSDVARQGFWASLTGGWYYEPVHSLFCNTLHLYIWTILFLLPVLIGIISVNGTGQFGFGLALCYLAIIGGIFVVIKLVVSWLHHIFDTVQPIKYKSKRCVTNHAEEQTTQQRQYRTGRFSGSSFSATRATESNAIDMIEMLEMHHPRSDTQNNVQIEELDEQEQQKPESKSGEQREQFRESRNISRYLSLPRSARGRQQGSTIEDDGEQSSSSSASTSSKCSAHGLLGSSEVGFKRGRGTILRTADSLDLLPIVVKSTNRMPPTERGQKLSRLHHKQRKYSEPNTFACSSSGGGGGSIGRGWRKQQRRRSEERPFAIRRVNSTSAGAERDNVKKEKKTSLMLPKTGSLGTHFPGGILVDELELNRWNWAGHHRTSQRRQKRQQQGTKKEEKSSVREGGKSGKEEEEMETREDRGLEFKMKDHGKQQQTRFGMEQKGEEEDDQRPCCSSSVLKKEEEEVTGGPEEQQPGTSQMSTSFEQGQPTTSAAASVSGEDLKGQITKFLEEMIEKHPDTLMDAIESVRTNRLFQQMVTRQHQQHQSRGAGGGVESEVQQEQPSQMPDPDPSSQQQQKHHLAADPTDTSQGAVHAFQDEHGNWFTYWFGTQSSGTAQPLISANEVSSRERRPLFHRNQHRQLARTAEQVAEAAATHGLPVTAAVVLEHSPSRRGGVGGGQQTTTARLTARTEVKDVVGRLEEVPQHPTNVNVVHRKRSSSSSSLSSIAVAANATVEGMMVPSSRSSSSDSTTRRYLPNAPTNVFRAGAIADEGRGTTASGALASSILQMQRNSQGQANHGRQLSESSRQLIAFMQRICQGAAENPEFRARIMAPPGRRQPRARQDSSDMDGGTAGLGSLAVAIPSTPSLGSPSMNTVRLLNDLQMNRTLPPPFIFNFSKADQNRSRLKYCYRLKMPRWMAWWPFGGTSKPIEQPGEEKAQREFKLKMDRLSLASLFDRNFSPISCTFDVLLALLVGLLATLILSRGIYSELSLLAFAFVVAGSQFSLLKSVQPDSASPVHGYNYLVTYSRPIYFCLLATLLLLLDWTLPTLYPGFSLTWSWRPSWLKLYPKSGDGLLLSPRDICAGAILWLPIIFTLGLLPQINTLTMHVTEQLDMHLFGATASLTLLSALFSLARSCSAYCTFIALFLLMQHLSQTVDGVAFSALLSFTLAMAYLLSRASTNPLFVQLVWEAFWNGCKRQKRSTGRRDGGRQQAAHSGQLDSSNSTLTAPGNKQLLRCCISGSATAENNEPVEEGPSSGRIRRSGKRKEKRGRSSLRQNGEEEEQKRRAEAEDELLSGTSLHTLLLRSQHDLFSAILRLLLLFGLHCTSMFQSGQPHLERVLASLCIVVGAINHHIYPQLRAKYPWKLFAQPFLRPFEFHQFETTVEAKLTVFERVHVWMLSLEKNILYPLLIASLMSTTGAQWSAASLWTPSLLLLCAFRLARTGFAQPQQLYIPLLGTCLLLPDRFGYTEENANAGMLHSSPLLCLFLATIAWSKLMELFLKLQFILCYLAPWQISWGSAFHAFAQPFSVPHSGLTLAQAIISSVLSAPLNPFLGSSFFLMSYVRPVKFWERDYNTKRVDHSKLRLASQLDRGPMVDDSNLNAIFYEHLTRSLQKWLAGDLLLGRWACSVRPGDCFILASNYLNCMVQLVEIGNGFVTFQLRGLEFRGTYCHQREMEAISEDWADTNGACCCCSIGRLPGLISFNNAWTLRWLAWEVTVAKYVVDGYSISDNSAVNMLQVHELRRLLVTLYVKSMIFYAVNSVHFDAWLTDETVLKALEPIRQNARFVDPDPVFCAANDEDFDLNLGGLSRQSFTFFYGDWIEHCLLSRPNPLALGPIKTERAQGSGNALLQLVNAFTFALSILGRRALGTAAYNRHANAAESFLFGMHALFKGDMRITHPADEWVFTDPEILTRVISPAVRMALKLHQDHFAVVVDLDEPAELYEKISGYKERIFISHEHDPAWRRAILRNTPSLLALRHICDDGQDDYKVIMLNKRHLDMRVIKLNRECVRTFWAGQQQELIFLRNKNPERGSIQNARQVLRNMINSSADQPIGYPIYVSPLVTSFVETHPQLAQVLGPTLTFAFCWRTLCSLFSRLRNHFGPSGSSSAVHLQQQQQQPPIPMSVFSDPQIASAAPPPPPPPVPPHQSGTVGGDKKQIGLREGQQEEEEDEPNGSSSVGMARAEASGTSAIHYEQRGGGRVVNLDEVIRRKGKAKPKERAERRERRQHSISHSHLGVEMTAFGVGDKQEKDGGQGQARRSSATDTVLSGPDLEEGEEGGEELTHFGTFLTIQDPNNILPRLNEPLRSTGECLVQWPSEQWRCRGGSTAWPPDWRGCFKEGRLVHRWSPFHPDRAFRSHAGQICLLEIESRQGESWFVPVLEEGTRRRTTNKRQEI